MLVAANNLTTQANGSNIHWDLAGISVRCHHHAHLSWPQSSRRAVHGRIHGVWRRPLLLRTARSAPHPGISLEPCGNQRTGDRILVERAADPVRRLGDQALRSDPPADRRHHHRGRLRGPVVDRVGVRRNVPAARRDGRRQGDVRRDAALRGIALVLAALFARARRRLGGLARGGHGARAAHRTDHRSLRLACRLSRDCRRPRDHRPCTDFGDQGSPFAA